MSQKVQLNLNGNVLVKNLKQEFKDKTGATLEVYKGKSNVHADDSDKLSDIRIDKSDESYYEFARNKTVGIFEEFMLYNAKLKVKVWDVNRNRADAGVSLYNAAGDSEKEEVSNESNDVIHKLLNELAREGSFVSNFIKGNFLEKIFSSSKNIQDGVKVEVEPDKKKKGVYNGALRIEPSGWKNYYFHIGVDETNIWFGMCSNPNQDDIKNKELFKPVQKILSNGIFKIKTEDNNNWAQICRYCSIKKINSAPYDQVLNTLKKEAVEYFKQIDSNKKLLADNGVEL